MYSKNRVELLKTLTRLKKMAIITTHPIQYNAPLFKLLADRGNIQIKVFYTWGSTVLENKFDPGFEKTINWDIPLLEGYEYVFEKNISADPGSHYFKGIDNPELINHIEEWGADTVLVFGWSFKAHLQSLRYFHKKIPVYFRGDSTLIDEKQGLKNIVRTLFLKWVYRYVNVAFFVGTQNKLYYLKHGLRENQLAFAAHAVDNDRFIDRYGTYTAKALEWRHELKIADKDMVFLFAGKLEPKKDPELLIRAFIIMQQPDTHLIMVGNGVLEKGLKEKYAFVNKLHFIDFQNQTIMPVVYRLGNVFVLPSAGPGETWGLGVNEAMACERPVLVSNKVGCAVDLVDEGKNGFIFNSGDEISLAKKMCFIFKNNSTIDQMGMASYNKVVNWNFNSFANSMETVINR